MNKWKITIFSENARGVLKRVDVYAEGLLDVSRILMTFNARKGDVIYRYEVEISETLV